MLARSVTCPGWRPIWVVQDDFGDLGSRQASALAKLIWRQHADRVGHDRVRIVRHAAHRGELILAWLEGFSGYSAARDAHFLEFSPVVHTARTAGPSITYAS